MGCRHTGPGPLIVIPAHAGIHGLGSRGCLRPRSRCFVIATTDCSAVDTGVRRYDG